jgi:hypothetical protein
MKRVFQTSDPNTSAYRNDQNPRIKELSDEIRELKAVCAQYQSERDQLLETKETSKEAEEELKDVKTKLRIITSKFSNVRKERDKLKTDNRALQTEIMELQANMRQMVPGLQNTSGSFPVINELGNMIEQFYKCDCQDLFFEMLCPELSMEGVLYFFKQTFPRSAELVTRYFEPAERELKRVSCVDTLEGPVMNVLRKAYQANWKRLYAQCRNGPKIREIVRDVQAVLKLGEHDPTADSTLEGYVDRLGELLLCFYISDPPVTCDWGSIGEQVEFNPMKHEAMDGFIRAGDLCYILLPSCSKPGSELLCKANVLHKDYEFPC